MLQDVQTSNGGNLMYTNSDGGELKGSVVNLRCRTSQDTQLVTLHTSHSAYVPVGLLFRSSGT